MGEAAKDDTPKTMWDNIALLLFFVGWYVGNIYYNQYNKMALDGPPHVLRRTAAARPAGPAPKARTAL